MEHGTDESDKEQSQMEMTIKTEVEVSATSTANIDSEIDLNHLKQEAGLVLSVKSEPPLLVKEEILEDSTQDGNEQQCVQGTPTSASTGSVNDAYSTSLGDVFSVKHELDDMYIGPTILQHMDIHYNINKNKSAVTEESAIGNDCNKAMPCIGRKESVKVKSRDNKTKTHKYCGQTTIEEDYNEAHPTSCHGQQDSQQHLRLHPATSSSGFKYDASERASHKLHLLGVHKKPRLWNKSKTSVITSNAVAGPSNQNLNETKKHKPFVCNICEKRYSSKASLGLHKRSHSGVGMSVCHICDAKFSLKSNLTAHLRIHTGEKPFYCATCGARYAQRGYLTKHIRVHTGERPYRCDVCSLTFGTSTNLARHKRVHMGERSYWCDVCSRRFGRRSNLAWHMRVHTGEKPYQCDLCDARLASNGQLINHMSVHTGEKPYQCDTCDAKFTHSGALKWHMSRVHLGEKHYQCDTCDAKFAKSSGLTAHMRVHTGEKPFQCDACDARFAQRGALTLHTRVHTGEKPFGCSECGTKFARKSYLKKHMKRLHTK